MENAQKSIMQDLATNDLACRLTPTGIEFLQELGHDDWVTLGGRLGNAGRSLGLLIGDWLVYGDGKINAGIYPKNEGGVYHDAMIITGLDYQTLANYASVARKVPHYLRKEHLSFEHHRKVAALKDEHDKAHWLGLAELERERQQGKPMSARRLAKSILAGRVVSPEEMRTPDNDQGQDNIYPYLNRLVAFWGKLKQAGWPESTDPERLKIMIDDMQRVIDIRREMQAIYDKRTASSES